MVINLLLMIVLIWFVIHNFIKAKKFVSFNNWHDYFVPIYSIVLFLVTMKWDTTNVTIFLILLPVAFERYPMSRTQKRKISLNVDNFE